MRTPATGGDSPDRGPAKLAGRIPVARLRDLALVPAIIAIAIVGQVVNPVFLHHDNLINVLQTMSEIGLLVLGQTLVLIVGKMDLSLESTFGLAPGVAAWLIAPAGVTHGLGALGNAWAVPITLLIGVLIGCINALFIVRFKLNGFIVTLGMLITLRGLLTGISKGQTFFQLPSSLTYLGQNSLAGVPLSVWLCVGLFLAFGGRWASRAGAGRSTPSAATSMPPGRRASARTE